MQTFVGVGDDALIASLLGLVGSHRQVMVEVLHHLVEVESRRIHLRRGFGSMFGYCVEVLGFSEDEACRRIDAARMGSEFPAVFGMLKEGTVTLSVLGLLGPRINAQNAQELLGSMKGLTVRKAKEWLAARFPEADVRDSIRRLPLPTSSHPGPTIATVGEPPTIGFSTSTHTITESIPNESAVQGEPVPEPSAPPPRPDAAPAQRGSIEPLSAERFSVKFTVSRSVREKLELARDLARHRNPVGGLEALIEMALDALLEDIARKKLGKAQRPRPPANSSAKASRSEKTVATAANPRGDAQPSAVPAPAERIHSSRYIPRHVRRAVVDRDGVQCAHVATDGKRCAARCFLEFDHVAPVARGGSADTENVRLLCRSHNRLAAEEVFGREHVAAAVQRSREQSSATSRTKHAPAHVPAGS